MNDYMMTLQQVRAEMDKLNHYLQNCLWMEFDFSGLHSGLLGLIGNIDRVWPTQEIMVEFILPECASFVRQFIWNSDQKKTPFIRLANETEQANLNTRYHILKGTYTFIINEDNYGWEAPIFVTSRQIRVSISGRQEA